MNLLRDCYEVIGKSHVRLFAVALEKSMYDGDPYERCFEELLNRFDRMVSRVNRERDEKNRGLIVLAESSYRENLEVVASRIAKEGHRWGQLRNLADIPYFTPARNTRLLQLADAVANAVYGRYEHSHARHFDIIAPRFDQDGGQLHGLRHHTRNLWCMCIACVARRSNQQPEPTSH